MSREKTRRHRERVTAPRLDPTPREIKEFRKEVEEEFQRLQRERKAREMATSFVRSGKIYFH